MQVVIKRIFKIQALLFVMLVSVYSVHAQNKTYIDNHKVIARVLSETYGIPAPVILAIAAVESSGGKGPTARVLHNHFGIVGKNSYVNHRGHKSRYKEYPNVYASYIDFCQLMTRKRFYSKLKGSEDCKAWVHAISASGYSEVPEEWTQKVMSVLSRITTPATMFLQDPVLASK